MARNNDVKKDRPMKFKNKAEEKKVLDQIVDKASKYFVPDQNPKDYVKYDKKHHLN